MLTCLYQSLLDRSFCNSYFKPWRIPQLLEGGRSPLQFLRFWSAWLPVNLPSSVFGIPGEAMKDREER